MIPTTKQRLDARKQPINRSVVMYQSWKDLLFLHWEIDADEIQSTLPPGLTVDTFDGKAYVGIVPFWMNNIRPRFLPPVLGISNFLEMNVRTYVYDKNGTPGVWFYSLDANQKLAVRIARRFFKLPYFDAKMSAQSQNGEVHYQSLQKKDPHAHSSSYDYKTEEELPPVNPDSLEFFLLERYFLFSYDESNQQLYSGQVHHQPYPLKSVYLTNVSEHPAQLAGFDTNGEPPIHAIASAGVDVEVFPLQKVR